MIILECYDVLLLCCFLAIVMFNRPVHEETHT